MMEQRFDPSPREARQGYRIWPAPLIPPPRAKRVAGRVPSSAANLRARARRVGGWLREFSAIETPPTRLIVRFAHDEPPSPPLRRGEGSTRGSIVHTRARLEPFITPTDKFVKACAQTSQNRPRSAAVPAA